MLPPEVARLVPELFRRVAIPYFEGFSGDRQSALADIVDVGLGGNRIARKQAVELRLKKYLEIRLGRQLKDAPHLDEFAVAFGYLEAASGNYFAGRYGLVGRYLEGVPARERRFSLERARLGLLVYSLLDRHGDCVLPALSTAGMVRKSAFDRFYAGVQEVLRGKATAWRGADFPRNAAYREGSRLYTEYLMQWAVPSPWPAVSHSAGYPKKVDAHELKTIDGYLGRTYAYLQDLGFITLAKTGATLTSRGDVLVSALAEEGFAPSDDYGLSPSFEAIHDGFSVEYAKYANVFRPLCAATMERLIAATAQPGRDLIPWADVPELRSEYPNIVGALSESLSASARLDSVRLAMFLYSLGLGTPAVLDESASADRHLNTGAEVAIALESPKAFGLGHARSGRRFWSVTQLRGKS
jgi:hypothetical protein